MAMTKPVQKGSSINYVNAGTEMIAGRDVVPLANCCGIAQTDIQPGETGVLILNGVHQAPADTGSEFKVGQILYWNAAEKKAVASADGAVPLGVCTAPKAASAAAVEVKIGVALA